MNKIIIHGFLTRDPELKTISGKDGDIAVCNFGVAVNRYGEGADFFNCTAWRKTAELINKHYRKGKEILVEGSMQMDVVGEGDNKKTYWKLIVGSQEFCGKKDDISNNVPSAPDEPVDEYVGKTEKELYQMCLDDNIKVEDGQTRDYYIDKLNDVPF